MMGGRHKRVRPKFWTDWTENERKEWYEEFFAKKEQERQEKLERARDAERRREEFRTKVITLLPYGSYAAVRAFIALIGTRCSYSIVC